LAVGVVIAAALVVPYLLIAADAVHPLSIFVFAPLATCGLSGWRQTAIVAVLATVVAIAVEQFTADPLEGRALASRVAVIAVGGLFGAVTAAIRRRQEAELEEAAATVALAGALQLGLLPELERIDGFDVGVRYRAGEQRLLVGGDFLDLVPLDGDRLAFIVGDVCGHGPAAASLGAALRAGWRALVDHAPDDPVGWVHGLDRVYLRPLGSAEGHVTACTGIVDRAAGTALVVSAGHPWPVRLSDRAELLEVHAGQPMGLIPEAPASWQATTVPLAAGERLLVYTDGLIEARVEPGARQRRGHEELVGHLDRTIQRDVEPLLDDVVDAMATAGTGGYEDDVAVLLIGVHEMRADRVPASAGA
jgi:phosphoserine phosphatase RsbU/P